MKVEITRYVSLSESMSLLDELVENERAASDLYVQNLKYYYYLDL